MKAKRTLLWLTGLMLPLSLFSSEGFDEYGVSCKDVGQEWTWFSDHWVTSITYLVVPVKGASVQVGTGVFHHRPYGSITTINEGQAITAFGLGAIHVRTDATEPVWVCVSQTNMNLITIYKKYF